LAPLRVSPREHRLGRTRAPCAPPSSSIPPLPPMTRGHWVKPARWRRYLPDLFVRWFCARRSGWRRCLGSPGAQTDDDGEAWRILAGAVDAAAWCHGWQRRAVAGSAAQFGTRQALIWAMWASSWAAQAGDSPNHARFAPADDHSRRQGHHRASRRPKRDTILISADGKDSDGANFTGTTAISASCCPHVSIPK
jgi:hypothetical protein